MMMKTKFITGALVALIAVACSEKEQLQPVVPSAEGLKVTASVEQPGTRTSLDGLNVKWTVGDCIYLTDGTHSAIYEAIESSTTTSFSYVSGDTTMEGEVYAYYPAEMVKSFDSSSATFMVDIPSKQTYVANSFAAQSMPMTALATIEDMTLSLSFKNAFSLIRFRFTGEGQILRDFVLSSTNDLCGTAEVIVGEGGMPSLTVSGMKSVLLADCNETLSQDTTELCIAVPASVNNKFTFSSTTVEDGILCARSRTQSGTTSTLRTTIHDFTPMAVTALEKKSLLNIKDRANCYMVNADKESSICIPLSQMVTGWQTIDMLEESSYTSDIIASIAAGTVSISSRAIDGTIGTINATLGKALSNDYDCITLEFDGSQNGSNAVIDIKDSESKILWSWHIWFTDYEPTGTSALNGQVHTFDIPAYRTGGTYEGKVLMDRNLGATITGVSGSISQPATDEDAVKYFGLLYQFGRKDPFKCCISPANRVNMKSPDSRVTYAESVQNPTVFYFNANRLWHAGDDLVNSDPWNGEGSVKSAFDPCPAGWHIPVNNFMVNTYLDVTIPSQITICPMLDMTSYTGGMYASANGGEASAWFPNTGNINSGSGIYDNRYSTYWGSMPRSGGAPCYTFAFLKPETSSAYYNQGGNGRETGGSIRCIKE